MKKYILWGLIGLLLSLTVNHCLMTNAQAQASHPPRLEQNTNLAEVDQLSEKVNELYRQGKYTEAIPLAERAVKISRETLSPQDPKLATTLNNLALLYTSQGRYAQAEPLYIEALKIDRQALGDDHPSLAATLNNLAGLYRAQGQYDKAEPLLIETEKIQRQALGDDHPSLATTLNNLAALYESQGQYIQAEPLYQETLKIQRQALGNNHPSLAATLNNLAELYRAQGQYAQAEPLFKQAEQIQLNVLGENHPSLAITLNNLAELYQSQGQYAQAEPLLIEAEKIQRQALGDDHPSLATTLNNLAELYQSRGQYAQAEPLFLKAEQLVRRSSLGDNNPQLAPILKNLSNLLWAKGDLPKARKYLFDEFQSESLILLNHIRLGKKQQKKELLSNFQESTDRVISYHLQGKDTKSAEIAFATVRQRKGLLMDLLGNSFQQLHNSTDPRAKKKLDKYKKNSSKLSNHFSRNPSQDKSEEKQQSETLRPFELENDELSLSSELSSLTFLPLKDPELEERLISLKTVRDNITTLTHRGPGTKDSKQPHYKKTLQDLTAQENQLTQELMQLNPLWDELSLSTDLEPTTKLIPTNAALIEFIEYEPYNPKAKFDEPKWGEPRYAVYVLTHSGSLKWADLGPASEIQQGLSDINEDKKVLNQFIDAVQSPSISKEALQTIANPLYRKIFEPIRQMVDDKQHLLISPDGELNRIPFEALIDDQDQYLIETYQFTYLSSSRDLLKLQNDKLPNTQPSLLLAAPNYDSKTSLSVDRPHIDQAGLIRGSSTRSADYANLWFKYLPGAKEEGEAIEAQSSFNFEAKYEADATESLLKTRPNPQILHIATHGIFIEKQDEPPETPPNSSKNAVSAPPNSTILNEKPLLRSGLVFAGRNNKTQDTEMDDGLLTALEVMGLNLKATEMVVLSACQTGAGEVERGEGVYGLRRAFTIAGAQSQVMSLWDIPDDSTKELMVAYYNLLSKRKEKERGRGAALRRVQLDMLEGKFSSKEKDKDINYTTPYYWAPFIHAGDWRPLNR